MLKAVRDCLLSIIYPQECRVCSHSVESRDDGVACADCWAATRVFTGAEMLCATCGTFLGESDAPTAVYCHKCSGHAYESASAVGVYEGALAATVIDIKSKPWLASRVKQLIADAAFRNAGLSTVGVIVPVPLSRQRKAERGFNQAETIAHAVSGAIGVPVDCGSLVRKVNTPMHRVGMDQRARELTVMNVFEVVRPKLLAGKNVLLVDDVLTSGETASACARVLKKNGAASVHVFTLARAVLR